MRFRPLRLLGCIVAGILGLGASSLEKTLANYGKLKPPGQNAWHYLGSDSTAHYFFETLAQGTWESTLPRSELSLPDERPYHPEWPRFPYYYTVNPQKGFRVIEEDPARPPVAAAVSIPVPQRILGARHPRTVAAIGAPPVALEVLIETSSVDREHPELRLWAEHAADVCREWYGAICQLVAADGKSVPKRVTLVLVPHALFPAAVIDGRIYVDCANVLSDPTNYGMIVHEITHVAQGNRTGSRFAWLVEGIADYVRFQQYEADPAHGGLQPGVSKYTDSYRTTAAFLDYVVRNYDREIVKTASIGLRNARLSNADVAALVAKDPRVAPAGRKNWETLFNEFIASAVAAKQAGATELP